MSCRAKYLIIGMCAFLLAASASSLFAAGSKEGAAGKVVTIKIGTIYDPTSGESAKASFDWYQAIIAQYQKKYPNFKAEQEYFQWDQIDNKMMADYRAGITAHDVVMTTPQLLPEEGLVGDLADLTPYVGQGKAFSEADIQDFSWAAPWKKAHQNGKLIGIPLGVHTRVLVYNRDMFKAAGLDPNKPPTNLTELIQDAQKLTTGNVYGLGIFMGPSRATIELAFAPLIWAYGGKLWDPATKKAVFASPAGVKAAESLRDLVTKYKVTPLADMAGTYNDAVLNAFINEKVAMAWGWGSYWIQPLEAKGWIHGCFPPTAGCTATKAGIVAVPTSIHANFDNSWDISIYSRSQHKQAAWDFIQLALDPQRLLNYPDAGLPIRNSLWKGAAFQTPFYQLWHAAVAAGRPMPSTAHYGQLADTVAAAVQKIVTSNADPSATLQAAQDQYNQQYAGE